MRYWWASQGKNYQHVAHTGNLWTCPSASGRSRPDRELIKKLAPGDLVFHYARGELRALSEVTETWVHWQRPEHYPAKPGEGDDGWLVSTAPVVLDLEIPLAALTDLVCHGSPGPLDVNGRPMQKYLSKLEPGDAVALLQLIGVDEPPTEGRIVGDRDPIWAGAHTSVVREAMARREQAALRELLLDDRMRTNCDLCGRELPSALLVAAHIVPRHRLTADERTDLGRLAMLACALASEALVEHGHFALDRTDSLPASSCQHTSALPMFTRAISGRPSTAHTPATAVGFVDHLSHASIRRQIVSTRLC